MDGSEEIGSRKDRLGSQAGGGACPSKLAMLTLTFVLSLPGVGSCASVLGDESPRSSFKEESPWGYLEIKIRE